MAGCRIVDAPASSGRSVQAEMLPLAEEVESLRGLLGEADDVGPERSRARPRGGRKAPRPLQFLTRRQTISRAVTRGQNIARDPLPRSVPRRLGGALLLLAAFLPACRNLREGTIEGTRGVPPFFELYPTPSSEGVARGREMVFRPLGSFEIQEPEGSRLKLIYPFLDFQWGGRETRHLVLPLFFYRRRIESGIGADSDWMLFPLLFGGHDPAEGGYFAVFPFGGKVRGLLGKEEIDFVLFPFYARQRLAGRHSTHIVWPFFNTVRGNGWSGWRIWPFYGSYRWQTEDDTPRSRRFFILWPFYIRGEERLQSDPTSFFLSLPFYGYRENSRSLTRTYLWPLVIVHYDKVRDRYLTGGFFFPYRFGHGQFDPWPLFGVKSTEAEENALLQRRRFRQFSLWPIQRYDWSEDEIAETENFWLLPLYWSSYVLDKPTTEVQQSWKLWPLFGYRRRGEEAAFDFLSPLWFKREDYDRLYGRLFAVFRYRAAARRSGWELFYGAAVWMRSPEERVFSLLGGLLELGRREDDGFFLRLLYVPWW
jgi:hypothetical protein